MESIRVDLTQVSLSEPKGKHNLWNANEMPQKPPNQSSANTNHDVTLMECGNTKTITQEFMSFQSYFINEMLALSRT